MVLASRNERDAWLGRAIEAVLNPEEQQVLLAAGQLLQRLAAFEPAAAASGSAVEAVERGTVAKD
jgi:hypothetical protein